jgi:predicted CXXCH cytochrome family protein
MNRRFAAVVAFVVLLPFAIMGQDISSTRHNLSISGPGSVTTGSVNEICIFCHTPHHSAPSAPLWNREFPSGQVYQLYGSSTLDSSPEDPQLRTGNFTLLCLSCHDGTIALGDFVNPFQEDPSFTFSANDRGRLGTNLSDDHPVSLVYDNSLAASDSRLHSPGVNGSNISPLPLQDGQYLECTTCHDVHNNTHEPFLNVQSANGDICLTCHDLSSWNFATSSHATQSGNPPGSPGPWDDRRAAWRGADVAENSCFNCHTPHSAPSAQRLQKDVEEATCLECHDGSVANTNIQAEFNKATRHPITLTTGVHDPSPSVEPAVVQSRHVECVDCHNPHGVTSVDSGNLPGPLNAVRGVSSSGLGQVDPITEVYQLCFRCHAYSPGKPSPPTSRVHEQTNVALEFDTGNPSFHPVLGPSVNPNVPSLTLPPGTIITCIDCHNSDTSTTGNGSGPDGPHGSRWPNLLVRRYVTADNTRESPAVYALCFGCHDYDNILSDASFGEHSRHLENGDVPCNACHDPHGVSSTQATSSNGFPNNTHLINFDRGIVSPTLGNSQPIFEDRGTFSGGCTLSCHGEQHCPGGSCDIDAQY